MIYVERLSTFPIRLLLSEFCQIALQSFTDEVTMILQLKIMFRMPSELLTLTMQDLKPLLDGPNLLFKRHQRTSFSRHCNVSVKS